MGLVSGATNIICVSPNTMMLPFIPGLISFLSGFFYILDHLTHKKMVKQENQRLELIKQNNQTKHVEERNIIC